jgi:hypothetical protein
MCRRSPAIACADQHGAFWFRPDCLSWLCRECRPKLIRSWTQHAAMLFSDDWVFVATVPASEVKAVSRRLKRRDAGWTGIDTPDGRVLFSRSGDTLVGRWVPAADAIRLFADTLSGLQRPADAKRWTPVSTSSGWRPQKVQPTGRSTFLGHMTHGAFAREIARLGGKVARSAGGFIRSFLDGAKLERLCGLFGVAAPKPLQMTWATSAAVNAWLAGPGRETQEFCPSG